MGKIVSQMGGKYPVVMVEWRDAKNNSDWRSVDALAKSLPETVLVHSVGFLVKRDDREVVLAFGICEQGEAESTIAIPRDWCQKIKRIA
jgi:hypothetical protein